MTVRKINAGLSLVTTLLLLDHAGFYSVWMLSGCSIETSSEKLPRMLAGLLVIHAVLSIVLVIRSRKGADRGRYNAYPQMNIATYVQRISGVLMLLLLGVHIAGTLIGCRPKVLHAAAQPLFFAAALAHAAVSAGKAMVTLGIGNAKAVKLVDGAMKLICAVIFAAGVVGFYLWLFRGGAG